MAHFEDATINCDSCFFESLSLVLLINSSSIARLTVTIGKITEGSISLLTSAASGMSPNLNLKQTVAILPLCETQTNQSALQTIRFLMLHQYFTLFNSRRFYSLPISLALSHYLSLVSSRSFVNKGNERSAKFKFQSIMYRPIYLIYLDRSSSSAASVEPLIP